MPKLAHLPPATARIRCCARSRLSLTTLAPPPHDAETERGDVNFPGGARWGGVRMLAALVACGIGLAAPGLAQGPEREAKGLAGYTICVDPGHSKATVGAHGARSTEYRVVWQVAGRLKAALEEVGAHVVLTKRRLDENVPNEERAAIANRAGAALFLRLHCDAGSDSGIATFYPDRQGVWGGLRGPGPGVIAASRRLAARFHVAMLQGLGGALPDRGVRTDAQTAVGGRQGGALTGSIYSRVPVLLVELCVLTNRKDEDFILSEEGQSRLVRALAAGVNAALAPDGAKPSAEAGR